MTQAPEPARNNKSEPPASSLERAGKVPAGSSGLSNGLQPGGTIPGGGPAGAGSDDMGKSKKEKGKGS